MESKFSFLFKSRLINLKGDDFDSTTSGLTNLSNKDVINSLSLEYKGTADGFQIEIVLEMVQSTDVRQVKTHKKLGRPWTL